MNRINKLHFMLYLDYYVNDLYMTFETSFEGQEDQ